MRLRERLLRAQLRVYMRHLAASKRPIVVGPFTSELGFEMLYWLPFVGQLRADYGLSGDRLIALGRGGTGALYDTAGRSDVYAYLPVDAVRVLSLQKTAEQQTSKQLQVQPWERHVVQLAAASMGLQKPLLLHPSWMYGLLHRAWIDKMTMRELSTWLNPLPLPQLALPDGLDLPPRFVAVRIYARATMEPHDQVVLYLKQQLTRLAKKQPLVFLSGDTRYDDHADIIRPFGDNMIDLGRWLKPQNNLAVQIAVLQRCSAFVGTYGGLAQTALRCGRPAYGLFTKWGGTAFVHVDLTHRLALSAGVPFTLVHVQSAEELENLW